GRPRADGGPGAARGIVPRPAAEGRPRASDGASGVLTSASSSPAPTASSSGGTRVGAAAREERRQEARPREARQGTCEETARPREGGPLSRYRVERVLGAGGMATVQLAHDE